MKIKVKDLKKMLNEYVSDTHLPYSKGYSYRNEFSNRVEVNLPDIIQNSWHEFCRGILMEAVENDKEQLEMDSPVFGAQMNMATIDMVALCDSAFTSKVATIARRVVEKLKEGKYTESDRLTITDIY